MLTRALDTRVAEAAQLRKALEVAKREAARSHTEMDELRQAGPDPDLGPLYLDLVLTLTLTFKCTRTLMLAPHTSRGTRGSLHCTAAAGAPARS